MTRKYFGTDGIRGKANTYPMTADMALKAAMATALVLKQEGRAGDHKNRAVIGKDPRLSGYMLEQAMTAGFLAMGMDVFLTGPLPTPAIARLTRTLRADVGVMISASHNNYQDNGIKLFAADGYKLPDEMELEIERWMDRDMNAELPGPAALGKATRIDDAQGRYVEFVKRSFPREFTLEGMKIVIDCANGAAYKVAPQVLWELEAEIIPIGVSPNGRNINAGCGATDTALLQQKVVEEGADIGIALDGDADRLIVIDEKGNRVDGDQIMALLAVTKKEQGFLQGGAIVSTVMSNLGLERFLKTQDLDLIRTPVGDRYVVETMREKGCNIGGEQSGHMILSDFSTTGDGLLAALQVLAVVKEKGCPASTVLHLFDPLPQILNNVRFEAGAPLESEIVKAAIRRAEETLAGDGRVLVRASGTEPLIRVMAEGDDLARVETIVNDLCSVIETAAKSA
ncbi:MAG: phosphoglucosamine mutase [Rhodospirillales bacterium]|nr:phosphoglucosamine mutase [Rhodospirillales bacterium]